MKKNLLHFITGIFCLTLLNVPLLLSARPDSLTVQKLRRTLLNPLQEISQVTEEYMQGNRFRRCNMHGVSADMRKLFTAVNDLLDRCQKS